MSIWGRRVDAWVGTHLPRRRTVGNAAWQFALVVVAAALGVYVLGRIYS